MAGGELRGDDAAHGMADQVDGTLNADAVQHFGQRVRKIRRMGFSGSMIG